MASADTDNWQSTTIPNLTVHTGDEIRVEVKTDGQELGKLDYVQLNYKAQAPGTATSHTVPGPLDDPAALPGQVIAAGRYDLKWYDMVDGDTVIQTGVLVPSDDDVAWSKPWPIGNEIALYIKRQSSSSPSLSGF